MRLSRPLMIGATAAIALFGLTACQTARSGATPTAPGAVAVWPDVTLEEWIATLRVEALGRGVRPAVFDQAFANVKVSDRVSELDSSQPEFTRQVWQYLDSAVADQRVKAGRERLARHQALMARVKAEYGVPPEILVAFWGVESDFGASMGNFKVIDALTTLAYRGRRTGYFRGELLTALDILNAGDIAPERMRGSWAGAMGQTQFMPTIFAKHAVDADGDGRRDIWDSLPDVLASTARFVRANQWRPGESWGGEVRLPQGFPYQDAELTITKSKDEWARLGVRMMDGTAPRGSAAASILVLAGHRGPAFLVEENFRAIMRYNPSTSYALAVALLADRMSGKPGVQAAWPRDEAPLSNDERVELQTNLDKLGHAPGVADGIIGANTRQAIRRFQLGAGMIADGFATKDLLARVRQAAGV